MTPSAFRSATMLDLDDVVLQHLIVLITRYVEQWGRNPTPEDLRRMILNP